MSIIFKTSLGSIFISLIFMGFGSSSSEKSIHSVINTSTEIKSELLKHKKAIYISIKDQRLYIIYKKKVVKEFDISSSKYGVGFDEGSYKTPLGLHYIKKKIGKNVPINGIFKFRKYYGDLSIPNDPEYMEKDLITTRILWLSGMDDENKLSYYRYIYIHGTPEETSIGKPSSHGCIRMKNLDVYALFEFVDNGTPVIINQ